MRVGLCFCRKSIPNITEVINLFTTKKSWENIFSWKSIGTFTLSIIGSFLLMGLCIVARCLGPKLLPIFLTATLLLDVSTLAAFKTNMPRSWKLALSRRTLAAPLYVNGQGHYSKTLHQSRTIPWIRQLLHCKSTCRVSTSTYFCNLGMSSLVSVSAMLVQVATLCKELWLSIIINRQLVSPPLWIS